MTKNLAAPGTEILEAALHGLEAERDKLDQQIAQVRALLGHGSRQRSAVYKRTAHKGLAQNGSGLQAGKAAKVGMAPVTKRVLSVDARKRIAAAQRKRWAAFRKNQK